MFIPYWLCFFRKANHLSLFRLKLSGDLSQLNNQQSSKELSHVQHFSCSRLTSRPCDKLLVFRLGSRKWVCCWLLLGNLGHLTRHNIILKVWILMVLNISGTDFCLHLNSDHLCFQLGLFKLKKTSLSYSSEFFLSL